jgi:hypothetical protein
VVGPGGRAAGAGYAHWLAVKERLFFDTPAPGPKVCDAEHGPSGQPIAFLLGGARGKEKSTCDEPAGRPIYIDGLTNECSTVHGDHNGFGSSNAQLTKCARAGFKGLSSSATLDGAPVTIYRQLLVSSPVVTFHLPPHNVFGVKPQGGRSAAYGEGLLLSRLGSGTHTVRIYEHTPGGSGTLTYKIVVKPR